MKEKKILFVLAVVTTLTVAGCGNGKIDNKNPVQQSYLDSLEKDKYYVRHSNNSCEQVYFGNATFDEGETTDSVNDERVMWYRDDFSKIPTLYAGDSLIYCTDEELTETFNFERFEDFGYSIGLCGLTPTESGRYSVSTDPDDCNTYPGGDTDILLNFNNDTVIIDTLGGKELRVPAVTEKGKEIGSPLTRCKSIKGLKQGISYEAEVYEGTKRSRYTFKADVRILGSMEDEETTDYSFENEKIMNIKIPTSFHSGYYLINGMGLFRYVNGTSYDSSTDFNIPNHQEDDINNSNEVKGNSYEGDGETVGNDKNHVVEEDVTESSFTVTEPGLINVNVQLEGIDNASDITGVIITPSGENWQITNRNMELSVTFDAKEVGNYTIKIYDLGNGTATVNVNNDGGIG